MHQVVTNARNAASISPNSVPIVEPAGKLAQWGNFVPAVSVSTPAPRAPRRCALGHASTCKATLHTVVDVAKPALGERVAFEVPVCAPMEKHCVALAVCS